MTINLEGSAVRAETATQANQRRESERRRYGASPTIQIMRDPAYGDVGLMVRVPEVSHHMRLDTRAINSMESPELTLNNITESIRDDVATSRRNLMEAMETSVFNNLNRNPRVTTSRPQYTTATPLRNTLSGVEPLLDPDRNFIRNTDMQYYQNIAEHYWRGSEASPYESPPSLQPKTREPSVIYQQIKKYITEELELKVQTETVEGRLEIKVALVEISSGQELLESSDFTEIKDE